jgi:hypothetical protein
MASNEHFTHMPPVLSEESLFGFHLMPSLFREMKLFPTRKFLCLSLEYSQGITIDMPPGCFPVFCAQMQFLEQLSGFVEGLD